MRLFSRLRYLVIDRRSGYGRAFGADYCVFGAQMIETITALPAGDYGDCTGCDYVIKAAIDRNEKPPARGRSTWKFDRGGGKIYWLCLNCVCRAAHAHGVAVPSINPTGAKTIPLLIPR